MNKKLSGILGILLSLAILIYFETYFYKFINLIGIKINDYSSMIQLLINLAIKIIMCVVVYFVYKRDLKGKKGKDNLLRNLLIIIVSFVSIVLVMHFFNYVVKYIGDIFNIKVLDNDFYNIFNKTLDFNLVVKIVMDYIITPYLYCSIILLSVDRFCNRNDSFIILCGLLASIIYALSLNGTLGFVIVNSMSTFLFYSILAFIYKKVNSIWFVIILDAFYLLSNVMIINYLGW